MMKRLILTAVLACGLATPALAQTQPPPSPERMQAARELMTGMNMRETFEKTKEQMLARQLADTALRDMQDILRDFMDRALKWEDLEPEFVRIYAETYTADELRQLGAFYQTPLGRRMLETLPEISAKSNEISQRRVQQYLPEMMEAIMQRALPRMGKDNPGSESKKPGNP